jgi:hypothetical protein
MNESFSEILAVGGKSNALGRSDEVIQFVLADKDRLEELYKCVFDEDAWIRMRAIDAIEKIGRQQPEWLLPYIDRFQSELNSSDQPSILWHLAQMYRQLELTSKQRGVVIEWLDEQLTSTDVDWIVAANTMKTLVKFTEDCFVEKNYAISLIEVQLNHKSNTVVRTANKLLLKLQSL